MNNYSQFSYDGLWRKTKIVETVAGSITSTRQFVWSANLTKPGEIRDGGGSTQIQMFGLGQKNGSTKYFYSRDHLTSIREMTDFGGTTQAQYSFDSFGRFLKQFEAVPSDFQYAGYYYHSRGAISFTATRVYNTGTGRFISRDPIEEFGGLNLFSYVANCIFASFLAGSRRINLAGKPHSFWPPCRI